MTRRFAALVGKELRVAFNTPVAYAVIAGFLVFTSVRLFVARDFFNLDIASLRDYYGVMPLVFVVLIPAITMRSWAEERRGGTDEILLTLPVSERQLVGAKFVASLTLVLLALSLTGFVPLLVTRFGDFERGEIVGQYLGLTLLATASVAIGQLVSSLARNQLSAFVFAALVLLFLTGAGSFASAAVVPDRLASALSYLSLETHYRSFNRGVADTRDVSYFVAITGLALVLNTCVLLARKAR